jgi:hypothetical protein
MTSPDAVGGRWAAHLSFDMPLGQVGVAEGAARLEGRFDPTVISRVGVAVRRRAGTGATSRLTLQPAIGIPVALAQASGVDASAAWLEPGETRRWTITWRAGGAGGPGE